MARSSYNPAIRRVLNPKLYAALSRTFGEVRIANAGQTRVEQTVTHHGKLKRMALRRGETYRVCCPRCGDQRFRMYVSYLFGRADADGYPRLELVKCFNQSDCWEADDRRDLHQRLFFTLASDAAPLRPGKVLDAPLREIDWPGVCLKLSELEPGHHALTYLATERYQDWRELERVWDVRYCVSASLRILTGRLIFPMYWNGRLMGYQGRYVGELNWKDPNSPLKIFSTPGLPTSRLIFNLHRACHYATGIGLEGFFDCARIGPMGCHFFGSAITEEKIQLIVQAFAERTFVLVLDGDVFDPTKHSAAELTKTKVMLGRLRRELPGRFAYVRLPKDRDPDDFERDVIRHYITDQAQKQGVVVNWNLA
jgi:hypothetical protein